jgi:hypothetical protein
MNDDPTSEPSDRRDRGRRIMLKAARIVFGADKSSIECRVRNISEGGARLEFGTAQLLPHTFELHIPGMPIRLCNLRWAKDNLVGVSFAAEEG